MSYGLGIDVGTIFTAAAVVRAGTSGPDTPQILPLGSRSASIPTVVFLGEDGTRLVGEAAERRGLSQPECVAREFKRRMGDDVPLIVGGREVLPEELFAAVVTWVVEVATEREGGRPDVVTLTHPASWGGHRTSLLTRALGEAGIGDVVLMTEPEAAALSYASREHVADGSTLAVYDLGGGTFDATVVRKTDADSFSVLGVPQGLERLGGADFDQEIFHRVLDSAKIPTADLDPADPDVVAALNRLRRECAEAKEALSSDSEATVSVMVPGTHSSVRLVRSEFEAMIEPALAETIDTLHAALESAQVSAEDLTAILLVGGSSRIPLVAQLLSGEFDRPLAIDLDPKASVALGAAFATAALEDAPDQEAATAAGTAAGTAPEGVASDGPHGATAGTNAAGFGLPSRVPAPRHGPAAMASNKRLGLRAGAIAAAVALLGIATASATNSPNPLAALSALAGDPRAEAAEAPVTAEATEGATNPAEADGIEGMLGPFVAPGDSSNFLDRAGILVSEPTAAGAKSAEAGSSASPERTSRTTSKATGAAGQGAKTSQESPDSTPLGNGPAPAPSSSAAAPPGAVQKPGTSPVDPTPPVPFPPSSPTPTPTGPLPEVPPSDPAPEPTPDPTSPPEPPVTDPPVTEPPVTEPPVTEPPVTEPPVTEPPVTEPPVTDPTIPPPVPDPTVGATTPPPSPGPLPSSTEPAPAPTAGELPPPDPAPTGEVSPSYAAPES
ncbi:Hsp70 family protein [Arthrobacter burdickii]|uniref:Hsp70 family protein n=1 Tax=Arthrobacter burdickii TaxID=3035920 RepID=A0ABT8K6C3_9MICC|nr:Hsp70 family protein [Arthrobacter burdickii]MDN4612562.1 Hsp70 family protein [Arthrobacter burdickii]